MMGVSISQARRRKVAYLNLEAFRMVFLHTFDIDLLDLLTNKSCKASLFDPHASGMLRILIIQNSRDEFTL
jgi:hypothetical protein